MKILRKLMQSIEIIVFILGFVVGIYMLIFFPAKYFFTWHALPTPPEPVVKIISANHMGDIIATTTSNKRFICGLDNEKKCWTEINYEPLVFGRVLCFIEDCPDSHTIQLIKATGRLHSFGELSFIYSLRDDGNIYLKQSGFVYLPGYIMGVIIGGACAFIAYVVKHLLLSSVSLFQRRSSN